MISGTQHASTHWRVAKCSVHACRCIQLYSAQGCSICDRHWIIPCYQRRRLANSHTHIHCYCCIVAAIAWRECHRLLRCSYGSNRTRRSKRKCTRHACTSSAQCRLRQRLNRGNRRRCRLSRDCRRRLANSHTHIRCNCCIVAAIAWRECHRLLRCSYGSNRTRRSKRKCTRHACTSSAQCRLRQRLPVGDRRRAWHRVDRWHGFRHRQHNRFIGCVVVHRVAWREDCAQRLVTSSQNRSTHGRVAECSVHARHRIQLRSAQRRSIRDARRVIPCQHSRSLAYCYTHIRTRRCVVPRVCWCKCYRLACCACAWDCSWGYIRKCTRHARISSTQRGIRQSLTVGDYRGCWRHADCWHGFRHRQHNRFIGCVVVHRVAWREDCAQRLVTSSQNRSTHGRVAECSVHARHRIQLRSAQRRSIRDARRVIPCQHSRGFAYCHTHIRTHRRVVTQIAWGECYRLARYACDRNCCWICVRKCTRHACTSSAQGCIRQRLPVGDRRRAWHRVDRWHGFRHRQHNRFIGCVVVHRVAWREDCAQRLVTSSQNRSVYWRVVE